MLDSCDTMVALPNSTVSGQTLFAKNSDRLSEECQPLIQVKRTKHKSGEIVNCQFIDIPQVAVTYSHVGARPYWCWGYEHGFNEHQVVIGNEAVRSKSETDVEPKLIGMDLIRLGLERASSAAEAVKVITAMVTAFGQGISQDNDTPSNYDNSFIVADPREAYVIETAGYEWAIKKVDRSLGISNVHSIGTDWGNLSPSAYRKAVNNNWWIQNGTRFNFSAAYADFSASEGGRGKQRSSRSCTLLNQNNGSIDLLTMISTISDHSDGEVPDEPIKSDMPNTRAICMHHGPNSTSNTAGTLIADLCSDESRLAVYWCSFYSPCLGIFLPMFSQGEIPSILSKGDGVSSEGSPWWIFREIARSARVDNEFDMGRVSKIRNGWQGMQQELLVSAYQIAAEARLMISKGKENQATRLLNKYMRRNVTEALKIAKELTKEVLITAGSA